MHKTLVWFWTTSNHSSLMLLSTLSHAGFLFMTSGGTNLSSLQRPLMYFFSPLSSLGWTTTTCGPSDQLRLIQKAATVHDLWSSPQVLLCDQLLCSILPVAAHIRLKTQMLAYRAKNGPVPTILQALIKSCFAPRFFQFSSTTWLTIKTQGRHLSRLFSSLAERTPESLSGFKWKWKSHLFTKHLNEH